VLVQAPVAIGQPLSSISLWSCCTITPERGSTLASAVMGRLIGLVSE
jgi:hypothetical protein